VCNFCCLSIKTVGKVTKHKVPPKGFFSISVKHCFSLKHIDYKSSVFFRKHTSQYTHVNDSFPRHPGKKRGQGLVKLRLWKGNTLQTLDQSQRPGPADQSEHTATFGRKGFIERVLQTDWEKEQCKNVKYMKNKVSLTIQAWKPIVNPKN